MRQPHGLYLVTGNREYRGVAPGERFVARLTADAERRAVDRGDIQVLRRVTPTIRADRLEFPDGWLPADQESVSNEAPEGASNVGRSR